MLLGRSFRSTKSGWPGLPNPPACKRADHAPVFFIHGNREIMMSKQTFGFIGLRNIGGPRVRPFLPAGPTVRVFDRAAAPLARAGADGAQARSSALDVADAAATIFLSLPDGPAVQHVISAQDGLLQ